MKFESEREKIEIGFLMAKIKYLATANIDESIPQKARAHSMIKIIELIGAMGARMGGAEFTFTIPMYEAAIRAKAKEMREAKEESGKEERNGTDEHG